NSISASRLTWTECIVGDGSNPAAQSARFPRACARLRQCSCRAYHPARQPDYAGGIQYRGGDWDRRGNGLGGGAIVGATERAASLPARFPATQEDVGLWREVLCFDHGE